MFEQTRQHYLKQMGVTLWYSRCELPGAAESPEFLFGANLEGTEDSNTPPPASQLGSESAVVAPKSAADILNVLSSKQQPDDTKSGLSGLVSGDKNDSPLADGAIRQSASSSVDLVNESPTTELTVKSNSNEGSSSAAEYTTQNDVASLINLETLDLMLWVGEKNWFISDNDSEYPEQLKQQLLLNIASAMGESVELTRVTSFRWPFFGNQRLPGNDPASMLVLLREWLGGLLASDNLKGFLMGENVARLLLQESSPSCIGGTSILNISDERDIEIVTTLPLNDLLREPLNKRIVWQHLSSHIIK